MDYFASCYGGYGNQFDSSVSTLPNYWQPTIPNYTLPKYHGIGWQNPYLHVEKLEEICANDEATLVRLFSLSLEDVAKNWFHSLNLAT